MVIWTVELFSRAPNGTPDTNEPRGQVNEIDAVKPL